MAKWKVESVPDVVEGLVRHYVTDGDRKFQIAQGTAVANELSSLLNTLEEQNAEMQEERRWLKIGEGDLPKLGAYFQLGNTKEADGETVAFAGVDDDGVWLWVTCNCTEEVRKERGFTHWRPAPTDVPKEEMP